MKSHTSAPPARGRGGYPGTGFLPYHPTHATRTCTASLAHGEHVCTGHRIHTRTRLRKKVVRWSQFFALRRGAGGGRTYAAGASITPLMPTAAGRVAGGGPREPCHQRGSRQCAQGVAQAARRNVSTLRATGSRGGRLRAGGRAHLRRGRVHHATHADGGGSGGRRQAERALPRARQPSVRSG